MEEMQLVSNFFCEKLGELGMHKSICGCDFKDGLHSSSCPIIGVKRALNKMGQLIDAARLQNA